MGLRYTRSPTPAKIKQGVDWVWRKTKRPADNHVVCPLCSCSSIGLHRSAFCWILLEWDTPHTAYTCEEQNISYDYLALTARLNLSRSRTTTVLYRMHVSVTCCLISVLYSTLLYCQQFKYVRVCGVRLLSRDRFTPINNILIFRQNNLLFARARWSFFNA